MPRMLLSADKMKTVICGAVSRSVIVRRARKGAKDESGTASVEFVLWFPVFIMLLGLAMDVGLTIHDMTRSWDVARNATRKVAVGEMTFAEAKTYAESQISAKLSPVAGFTELNTNDVQMTLSFTPNVGLFGAFSLVAIDNVGLTYIMRKETNSTTSVAS